MTSPKLLIVNADDLGLTAGVNEGILYAHRHGIVTSATLMAGGAAFEHAVRLCRETPDLDVGCHLTLIGGRSVFRPSAELPRTPAELVLALAQGRLDLTGELRAQIERILAASVRVSHFDTHKHAHLWPPVARVVAELAVEYRIPWVRRPLGAPLLGTISARILERAGCRLPDHFLGFRQTGRLNTNILCRLLGKLKPGLSELMCHPGFCSADLGMLPTRLKVSRQKEIEALVSEAVRAAVEAGGIRLVNFRALD